MAADAVDAFVTLAGTDPLGVPLAAADGYAAALHEHIQPRFLRVSIQERVSLKDCVPCVRKEDRCTETPLMADYVKAKVTNPPS